MLTHSSLLFHSSTELLHTSTCNALLETWHVRLNVCDGTAASWLCYLPLALHSHNAAGALSCLAVRQVCKVDHLPAHAMLAHTLAPLENPGQMPHNRNKLDRPELSRQRLCLTVIDLLVLPSAIIKQTAFELLTGVSVNDCGSKYVS